MVDMLLDGNSVRNNDSLAAAAAAPQGRMIAQQASIMFPGGDGVLGNDDLDDGDDDDDDYDDSYHAMKGSVNRSLHQVDSAVDILKAKSADIVRRSGHTTVGGGGNGGGGAFTNMPSINEGGDIRTRHLDLDREYYISTHGQLAVRWAVSEPSLINRPF